MIRNVKVTNSSAQKLLNLSDEDINITIKKTYSGGNGDLIAPFLLSQGLVENKFPWCRLEEVPETYYHRYLKNILPKVNADQQKIVKDIVFYFTIEILLRNLNFRYPNRIFLASSDSENDFYRQVNTLAKKFNALDATYREPLSDVCKRLQAQNSDEGESVACRTLEEITKKPPQYVNFAIKDFDDFVDDDFISDLLGYAFLNFNRFDELINGYIFNSIINNKKYVSILNTLYSGNFPQDTSCGIDIITIIFMVFIATYKEYAANLDRKKIENLMHENNNKIYFIDNMFALLQMYNRHQLIKG